MKKTMAILLLICLSIGLCACSEASVYGSGFIGTYEQTGEIFEEYSSHGYNNLVHHIPYTETLILQGGGIGTFKSTATASGTYWQTGDIIEEGTVKWTTDGNYITITFTGFRYNKDYGSNTTKPIDHTATYEKKASTLHNASSGYLEYREVS